jgi:hypothetical protein
MTTEALTTEPPRTLSLVRLEAAYGPIYLVVCLDHEDGHTRPIDEVAKLDIETLGEPFDIFQHVVAVMKDGMMADPQMFTVVQTKLVSKDFDFDELSRSRTAQKWAAFFKGDWSHPDTSPAA